MAELMKWEHIWDYRNHKNLVSIAQLIVLSNKTLLDLRDEVMERLTKSMFDENLVHQIF